VAGLRAGDANAQYFRILSLKQRRRDHIASLRLGSQVATEQVDKEEIATNFYLHLLGTLMSTHASILVDSVGPPSAEVCRTAASFP
jgi:hypothetical protein